MLKNRKGISMVETIIVIALFGLLGKSLLSTGTAVLGMSKATGTMLKENVQLIALETVRKVLTDATEITTATGNSVVFISDTYGTPETYTLAYDSARKRVTLTNTSGGVISAYEGANALAISYRNKTGAVSAPVLPEELRSIRFLNIQITTKTNKLIPLSATVWRNVVETTAPTGGG